MKSIWRVANYVFRFVWNLWRAATYRPCFEHVPHQVVGRVLILNITLAYICYGRGTINPVILATPLFIVWLTSELRYSRMQWFMNANCLIALLVGDAVIALLGTEPDWLKYVMLAYALSLHINTLAEQRRFYRHQE